MTARPAATEQLTHVLADFIGVAQKQLRDTSFLGGLLIAAAGAAGFNSIGTPVTRQREGDTLSMVLILDDSHILLHAYADRELLLLDTLCAPPRDGRKVLDVFVRRIVSREHRSVERARG